METRPAVRSRHFLAPADGGLPAEDSPEIVTLAAQARWWLGLLDYPLDTRFRPDRRLYVKAHALGVNVLVVLVGAHVETAI